MITLDATVFEQIFDFIDSANIGSFTDTKTGAGTTFAAGTGVGGWVVCTTDANDNDRCEVQLDVPVWNFNNHKAGFGELEIKFKTGSDVTQVDLGFGMVNVDTDWLGDAADFTNGIIIRSDDGDANVDFRADDNTTDASLTAIATLAASTDYVMRMRVDTDADTAAYGTIRVWLAKWDSERVEYGAPLVEVTRGLPTADLYPTFGVQNGEAAAKTLSVDYVKISGSRHNPAYN